MGKEDNVGIKINIQVGYKKLLKKIVFTFYLDKKKPKNMQIFSYLKNQFRHMS